MGCPNNPRIYKALQDEVIQRIVGMLREKGGLTIKQIATAIDKPRTTVGYHMGLLEKHDLFYSEYKLFKEDNPRASVCKIYTLNEAVLSEYIECSKEALNKLLA